MKTVSIEPHFQAWRRAARALLAEQCHPSDVLWSAANGGEVNGLLFADEYRLQLPSRSTAPEGAQDLCPPRRDRIRSPLRQAVGTALPDTLGDDLWQ